MALLLIQNKGEAPEEAYTLMGASLSRDDDGLLGEFGSGSKLAICTLLRMGKRVIVYSGKTRMEFKTRTIEISDDIESQQKLQVYVQFGGTSTRKQDLGWVVDMGARDWDVNLDMAVREFVANAIDHTLKRGDDLLDARHNRDLCVEIVPDGLRKAQKGYTRVYIESCEKCEEYVDDLPRRFLQFTSQPLNQQIMAKINSARPKAQIYLCGAFVCELSNSGDSLFDYNFTKKQLKIDESRNLDEYSARAAIGRLFMDADAVTMSKIFDALLEGKACLETGLDHYYIRPGWRGVTAKQKETWQAAWQECHTDDTVITSCASPTIEGYARRKGFEVAVVKESAWVETAKEFGIKTIGDVLSEDEQKGRVTTHATPEAVGVAAGVQAWLMSNGVDGIAPCLRGFEEEGDDKVDGYVRDNVVYIRNDLEGAKLQKTVLEYIVRYYVKLDGNCQDPLGFLIDVCLEAIGSTQ